jgi:hypothetical protein
LGKKLLPDCPVSTGAGSYQPTIRSAVVAPDFLT